MSNLSGVMVGVVEMVGGASEESMTPEIQYMGHIAYSVVAPVIISFGILTNILNLVVLTRPSLRGPTFRYLKWLAVANLLVCVVLLPFTLHSHADPVPYPAALYLAHVEVPVGNALIASSAYIVVGLSIDRFVAVCYPRKYRNLHSHYVASVRIALSFVMAFIIYIPMAFYKMVVPVEGAPGKFTISENMNVVSTGWFMVYEYMVEISVRFAPAILLAVLNTWIIVEFKRISRRRLLLSQNMSCEVSAIPSQSYMEANANTTVVNNSPTAGHSDLELNNQGKGSNNTNSYVRTINGNCTKSNSFRKTPDDKTRSDSIPNARTRSNSIPNATEGNDVNTNGSACNPFVPYTAKSKNGYTDYTAMMKSRNGSMDGVAMSKCRNGNASGSSINIAIPYVESPSSVPGSHTTETSFTELPPMETTGTNNNDRVPGIGYEASDGYQAVRTSDDLPSTTHSSQRSTSRGREREAVGLSMISVASPPTVAKVRPGMSERRHDMERRLVLLLISIIVAFFITNIPAAVLSLTFRDDKRNDLNFQIFRAIANNLEFLNFGLNFILYFLFSKDIRNAFTALLRRTVDRVRERLEGSSNKYVATNL